MKNILKLTLFICSLNFPFILIGQTIDYNKRSNTSMVEYERKLNSSIIDTVEDFGILKKPYINVKKLIQTKAFIFKRNNDTFDPQLHIWYFYDHKKGENKGILYNWGLFNPDFNPSKNVEKLKILMTKEKDFHEKFNELKSEIENELGEPIKKRVIANNDKNYIEEIFWDQKDMIVGLSMHFSRDLNEIPGIGIFAQYHIQVMITYK